MNILEIGLQKGMEEGREIGIQQGIKGVVRNMLMQGMQDEEIIKLTACTEVMLAEVKDEISRDDK